MFVDPSRGTCVPMSAGENVAMVSLNDLWDEDDPRDRCGTKFESKSLSPWVFGFSVD